ncbi:hypothetical protein D9753_22415 [Streptomyces dangxiongensis]|uniref:Uncharacterized protein n=2 Tax=Streptomyces dangxiongensis TaxID=1442032 RepID=A0A3G2JR16_9ACTN|nr:hypothetical protein D9753_22415 [Streptomyces dangxiongensis]
MPVVWSRREAVPVSRQPAEAIRAWLAGAHPTAQVRLEWTTQRLALVPLRDELGAVRIPGDILHAAVGTDDPRTVAATVRDQLHGPVIHDVRTALGPTYWALVPYRGHAHWGGAADTPLLGPGTYLGVPDIGVTEPPGAYWVVQPYGRGNLCELPAVAAFIQRGRHAVEVPA